MLIIAILISVSLAIALAFLGLFLWNMKSGQYDDVYTPSIRILFEQRPRDKAVEKNLGSNGKKSSTN